MRLTKFGTISVVDGDIIVDGFEFADKSENTREINGEADEKTQDAIIKTIAEYLISKIESK